MRKFEFTYEYGVEDLVVERDGCLENGLRGEEHPVDIRLQDGGTRCRVGIEIVLVEGRVEGREEGQEQEQGQHKGRPRDAETTLATSHSLSRAAFELLSIDTTATSSSLLPPPNRLCPLVLSAALLSNA